MLVWNRQHLAGLQVQRCIFEHVHAVPPTRGRAHVQGHLKRVTRQCWIMQVFYQNRGASSCECLSSLAEASPMPGGTSFRPNARFESVHNVGRFFRREPAQASAIRKEAQVPEKPHDMQHTHPHVLFRHALLRILTCCNVRSVHSHTWLMHICIAPAAGKRNKRRSICSLHDGAPQTRVGCELAKSPAGAPDAL